MMASRWPGLALKPSGPPSHELARGQSHETDTTCWRPILKTSSKQAIWHYSLGFDVVQSFMRPLVLMQLLHNQGQILKKGKELFRRTVLLDIFQTALGMRKELLAIDLTMWIQTRDLTRSSGISLRCHAFHSNT